MSDRASKTLQERLRSRPMTSTYISWGREAADRIDALEKALGRALQAFDITSKHFEEVEVDGEMICPYDLKDELRAAISPPSDNSDAQAGSMK